MWHILGINGLVTTTWHPLKSLFFKEYAWNILQKSSKKIFKEFKFFKNYFVKVYAKKIAKNMSLSKIFNSIYNCFYNLKVVVTSPLTLLLNVQMLKFSYFEHL
jgi:hypothetical protein